MRKPSVPFYVLFFFLLILFRALAGFFAAIILAAILSVIVRRYLFEKVLQLQPPQNAAILITGTSSGFGQLFSYRFASHGILVFAGVRKEADGQKIVADAPEGYKKLIVPIILDVTKQEQIDKAIEQVNEQLKKEGRQLFGLINNAGITLAGPLECVSGSDFRALYDVNVFGQVAMTRAALPLLREYKGPESARILFVGSSSGFTTLPFMAAYSSSKFALESVADGFRIELAPWNIKVTIIEPGVFSTAIQSKLQPESKTTASDQLQKQQKLYPTYERWRIGAEMVMSSSPTGEPVAELATRILYSKFPPARAVVGNDGLFSAFMMWLYPDSVSDWIWRNNIARHVLLFINSLKPKQNKKAK